MRNGLNKIIGIVVVLGSIMMAHSAQAMEMDALLSGSELTKSNIGLYSQYVWRGQRQSGGAMSVQGDIGVVHESGLSANVWFATLGSNNTGSNPATEFDFTLDYSADLDFMGYSAGVVLYRYHNNGAANAAEIYAGANHDLGSVTAYYDTKSKNLWIDFASGLHIEEVAIDGTLSYSAPKVGSNEFVNLAVGVSKEIELDDVLLTPSFEYNYHMGALNTLATPDALVFSLNMTY